MKNGKYSHKGSKRTATLLLALVLLLGCGIGGTLAYLTANTNEVKNTFVVGDIGTLDLVENKGEDTTDNKKQFVIVPGVPMEKDPKVTYAYPVKTENEDEYVQQDVYIFVEVDAVAGTTGGWTFATAAEGATPYTYSVQNSKVHWNVADGWTLLKNEKNVQVYYRAVAASEIDADGKAWSVIKDDKIYVESTLVKEEVTTAAAAADDIVFKAYAIQQASFEVYGEEDAEGNKPLDVGASAAKAWAALTANP